MSRQQDLIQVNEMRFLFGCKTAQRAKSDGDFSVPSMEDVARLVERLIVMNTERWLFDATPGEVFSHYKELEKMD